MSYNPEAKPTDNKEEAEEKKEKIEEIKKIADEIRVLQENCKDYVVPLDTETIEDLLGRNLVYFRKSDDGRMLTTIYRMPLNRDLDDTDPNQIYKLGGLAVLDRKLSTLKALNQMMEEVMDEIKKKNISVLMCSGNKVVQQELISDAYKMEEFTPEEFKNKFPDLYALFMDSETKKEFSEDERIYKLFGKEKESEPDKLLAA